VNLKKNALLTSLFYLALRSENFLLLYAGRIWIESTEFLSLFPSKHTVSASLVLGRRHDVFVDSREI
jgi:hypothetical protein